MSVKLYRHFDKNNVLLYVGISLSAAKRLSEHHAKSWWGARISRMTIEEFPDREIALRAEAIAIHDENPTCNGKGLVSAKYGAKYGFATIMWRLTPKGSKYITEMTYPKPGGHDHQKSEHRHEP